MKSVTSPGNVELEAKFIVSADQLDTVKEYLDKVQGDHEILIAGVRDEVIDDQYFDTQDFALASHDASLRLRKTRIPGYTLTFKRNYRSSSKDSGLFRRTEIEGVPDVNLLNRIAQHAPWLAFHLAQAGNTGEFSGQLEMFRSMGLYDVCRILNNRRILTVIHGTDLKMEVCFDRVECSNILRRTSFHELECEYLSGDKKAFRAFCEHLVEAMPWLKPSRHNKYINSLIALKIWNPSKDKPSERIKLWNRQLSRIFSRFQKKYEQALRFKKIENLHKARVSLRQLITLLEFLIIRDQTADSSAKELHRRFKKIQKLLGKVRDYDVFIDGFEKSSFTIDSEEQLSDELQHLLELERDHYRLKAIRRLPKFYNKNLSKHWQKFLKSELPDLLAELDLQADYVDLRNRFRSTAKQFLKSRELRGPMHPITVKNMHRTRILSKNLRYAAEYLAFALPGDQEHEIKTFKNLQTTLGDINDMYNHLSVYKNMKERMEGLVGDKLETIIEKLKESIKEQLGNIDESTLLFDDLPTHEEILSEDEEKDNSITDIRGIGPKTAEKLRDYGISTLEEIAGLGDDAFTYLAEKGLDIKQLAERYNWVAQAEELIGGTSDKGSTPQGQESKN